MKIYHVLFSLLLMYPSALALSVGETNDNETTAEGADSTQSEEKKTSGIRNFYDSVKKGGQKVGKKTNKVVLYAKEKVAQFYGYIQIPICRNANVSLCNVAKSNIVADFMPLAVGCVTVCASYARSGDDFYVSPLSEKLRARGQLLWNGTASLPKMKLSNDQQKPVYAPVAMALIALSEIQKNSNNKVVQAVFCELVNPKNFLSNLLVSAFLGNAKNRESLFKSTYGQMGSAIKACAKEPETDLLNEDDDVDDDANADDE